MSPNIELKITKIVASQFLVVCWKNWTIGKIANSDEDTMQQEIINATDESQEPGYNSSWLKLWCTALMKIQ